MQYDLYVRQNFNSRRLQLWLNSAIASQMIGHVNAVTVGLSSLASLEWASSGQFSESSLAS